MIKKSSWLWLSLLGAVITLPVTVPRHRIEARAQNANQKDVAYGEAGGQKLLLDVYGANAAVKQPAIVLVHGGSWNSGSKKDFGFVGSLIAQQGYVCFSVDYRLVKGEANRYPAQIDDVQRAVRWIRAHADDYGVIPDKIGALGASAGGHLVALLGTTETRDNSDTTLAGYSSRVQCVVDLYGPTDFTPALDAAALARMTQENAAGARTVEEFLGPLPDAQAKYTEASPITHIDKKTVPFLIFHGGKDTLVPLDQSQSFDAALRQAGIESKLIVFPNAGHAYSDSASLTQTFTAALQFFNRHLKQ